jgi:hypothetical protein
VTSQHSNKQRSWRPDPDEYKASQDLLADRGRTMTAYLGAALRWLNHDPEQALAALSPHWPDTRLGRPRTPHPDPAGPDQDNHDQDDHDQADPPASH